VLYLLFRKKKQKVGKPSLFIGIYWRSRRPQICTYSSEFFASQKPLAVIPRCSKYSQELNSRLKLRSLAVRYALHFIQGKFFTS